MIAETTTTPLPQLPDARIEKPGPCMVEPIDVGVDIYVPMEPRKTNLGKRVVSAVVKAEPCLIFPEVLEDE